MLRRVYGGIVRVLRSAIKAAFVSVRRSSVLALIGSDGSARQPRPVCLLGGAFSEAGCAVAGVPEAGTGESGEFRGR